MNVEFERKVAKNLGHDEDVKFVPNDESKGVGRDVEMTVTEGVWVADDVVVEGVSVLDDSAADDEVEELGEEVRDETSDEVDVASVVVLDDC